MLLSDVPTTIEHKINPVSYLIDIMVVFLGTTPSLVKQAHIWALEVYKYWQHLLYSPGIYLLYW